MKSLIIRIFATVSVVFVAGPANISAAPTLPSINTSNVFLITSYGASTANADNASAIQSAVNAAAAAAGGGTVEIPAGIFLSGPFNLKSKVNLQIDAGAILRMLPYGTYPSSGANFITASGVNDVEISGAGAIDGQGGDWWPNYKTVTRPIMIRFQGCNRQLIQDVTLSNSPMFHLSFSGSKGNITVRGVTISAPPSSGVANPSHNTDACDVSGTNILVENCNISVGDDDFTCGGNTADVLLTNNTYGSGHGVSIGSYTDGGVSHITVINCTFNGTDNGIRIKSERGRGGLVQDLKYLNLRMTNVAWPLLVYGYYEYGLGTLTSVDPAFAANTAATNATSLTSTTPIYHDITFSNIVATAPAGRPPLMVWGLPEALASNIVFRDVHITSSSTLAPGIYNATNIQFIDCSFGLPAGVKTMQMWNANVIFTNTTTSTQVYQLDGLTTNGLGNSLEFDNAAGALQNTNALDHGPLTLAASTFTVNNNLTLYPTTVLNFTLGTNATTLAVAGNLVLGGTNNILAGPGFSPGTYTVMTYTGKLSGDAPQLESVPAGYHCSFDTNTPGQVRLIVASVSQNPPPAPAGLAATTGNGGVDLSWAPVAGATSYHVKRSTTSGSGYVTNATVTGTSYTDVNVTGGTVYYYVVSAINAAGESTNSAEVSITALAPEYIVITTNVFNDAFAASTLNSSSPFAPTRTGTSFEIISSKGWNPTPSLSPGHLKFGINATSSGGIQVQARFADPVTLTTMGDSLALIVPFTNTAGLLTGPGALGFGLYQSGGNFPVPGGLNGTATVSSSSDADGNARTWMGYVGQIAFTGGNSQIITRPAQITGAFYNSDQDLVTSGSNSSSYTNDPPVTVGNASPSPSVTLTAGDAFVEVLSITLSATNELAITNSLYAGTDTNGTLISQFGGLAAGTTFLTNSFDALAIGWRETGSQATAIDINGIKVNSTLTVTTTNDVSLVSTNLNYEVAGNQLQLSWPADHLGWRLQIQTNNLSTGMSTNWTDVPGSAGVISTSIPINPSAPGVFLRLVYP